MFVRSFGRLVCFWHSFFQFVHLFVVFFHVCFSGVGDDEEDDTSAGTQRVCRLPGERPQAERRRKYCAPCWFNLLGYETWLCSSYPCRYPDTSSIPSQVVDIPFKYVLPRVFFFFSTRATVEARHFFIYTIPQFGSSRPLVEAVLEKNKTAMIPDEKSHDLGTRRESCQKKDVFPTILG